jgi:hypothetical protein
VNRFMFGYHGVSVVELWGFTLCWLVDLLVRSLVAYYGVL